MLWFVVTDTQFDWHMGLLPQGMWDLSSSPGVQLVPLDGRFLTAGPQGKSQYCVFYTPDKLTNLFQLAQDFPGFGNRSPMSWETPQFHAS